MCFICCAICRSDVEFCNGIEYLTFFEISGVNVSSRAGNVNLIAVYSRLFGDAVRFNEQNVTPG